MTLPVLLVLSSLAFWHVFTYGPPRWRDGLALGFLWLLAVALIYSQLRGGFAVSPARYLINLLWPYGL
ncbi:MAG: hypothetical protein M1299_07980 [Firmicutes bacterium]|nr:hypothetical protein [Bacillota bacterium]MCL5039740.1 hypothetical protein [Bacillota bacterium]